MMMYEKPVAEIIALNASTVMYVTSLPQGGENETGGAAESKPGDFDDEEEEEPCAIRDVDPWTY